jgi:hypothetical protein
MPEMTRRMLGLDATPPAGTAAGTAAGAVAGTVTGTVTGAAAGTVAGNVRVRAGQERAGDAGRYRVGRDLGAAAPLGRGLEKRCRADKTRTMAPARRGHGRGGGERAGGKAGGGGKR